MNSIADVAQNTKWYISITLYCVHSNNRQDVALLTHATHTHSKGTHQSWIAHDGSFRKEKYIEKNCTSSYHFQSRELLVRFIGVIWCPYNSSSLIIMYHGSFSMGMGQQSHILPDV